MKKIFYLASIAALAFSSCAKDETTEAAIDVVKGGSKITAAVEANDTRTHLDSNLQFRWSEGDQLGVYGDGANTLRNAAFTVSPDDAGKAQGVFTSQQEELVAGKHYLAVYPRFQQSRLFDVVNWTKNTQLPFEDAGVKGDVMDHSTIRVSIPATQTYKDGSFYTGMAPAISNNFTVANEGIGSLSMQPVADYLFVNIKSTEPIEEIKLQLIQAGGSAYYKIAGKAVLNKYALEDETIRYYASIDPQDSEASEAIVLETNESDKAVTCHDPNTYVFVVPGGILGTDADVRAVITVNPNKQGATNNVFTATTTTNLINGTTTVTAAQLNYAVPNPLKEANTTDNKKSYREASDDTDPRGVITDIQTMQLENMVFWMNPMIDTNNDGKADTRSSFEYNPEGDVIIENEAELLQYMVEYEKGTDPEFAGKDAFICDNYKFDFSIANIENLSAKLEKLGVYDEFEDYLNDYVGTNGTFPCIETYANVFNGNGATISGIVRPLASEAGIFGDIEDDGAVKDVTFSGITPQKVPTDNYGSYYNGYVLGNATHKDAIKSVTVNQATGMAVLSAGNVDNYSQLTITNAQNLNFIIADMELEKNLTFKNWDAVKNVATKVFGTLNAPADKHTVVTLPAGANYDNLALYIGNADTDYWNYIPIGISGYTNCYPTNVVDQADNAVVSVMVDKVSYWTGDKFVYSDSNYYTNDDLLPSVYDEGDYEGWYKIKYAEQMATGGNPNVSNWTGGAEQINVVIENDMNLSKSPMPWEMIEVEKVEGQNKVITGLKMNVVLGRTSSDPTTQTAYDTYNALYADGIAPVKAAQVKNLNLNGVAINVVTLGNTKVPGVIGGFAISTDDAGLFEKVNLQNLTITGAGEGANNEAYNGTEPVVIGWLIGSATDVTVKNSKVSGVNNEIIGIAGLVGKITLTDAAAIENSYVQNVTAQAALPKFRDINALNSTAWAKLNTAGTAVGLVENTATGSTKSIKITGTSGKAVFLFDTNPTDVGENPINVLYGNGDPITLKYNPRGEWYW